MKKILSLICMFLFAGTIVSAQDAFSVVKGHWENASQRTLSLFQFSNGSLVEISKSTIDKKGNFGFAFVPEEENFYVVAHYERSAINRYVFYLKPGDDVQFTIKGDTYHLTGKNTPENVEMERWHDMIQPLEGKAVYFMHNLGSTFREFFPEFENKLQEINNYPKTSTKNTLFNERFEEFKRYNLVSIAMSFICTPRKEHPKPSDYIDYYRNLNVSDLSKNTSILFYPNGLSLLENVQTTLVRANPQLDEKTMIEKLKSSSDDILSGNVLTNDIVKAEFMLYKAANIKSYDKLMAFKEKYEKLLVTDEQKARFREILGKVDDNSAGHAAIDFKFRDINGKQVSLSDFKGKVVYIDVWATWCGPCKQEIPFMGELEKEYEKNKDIVFMSVSIDQEKDIDKWKAMVKEKDMKGVQLFAGDKSNEIGGPYKIKTIPRFILIGKDGKVVDANAPRPSTGETIRTALNNSLKQK